MTRVRDIALIAIFAPLIVAIVVLTAVATLVFLGRPVFFTQERAGKGGKAFKILKFRTMLLGDGPDEERLTKFGSFLRKTSLDELPELWNVLKGEMSLVGPRPLPVRYLPRYSKEQNRRHEVLPGITGLAQINGRNALSWEDKFKYDVLYVDSKSWLLDLKILFLTVFQLIRPRGIAHEGEATMSEFKGCFLALIAAFSMSGCTMWRAPLTIDYHSRVIRVQPMDRISFTIEAEKGCEWVATSDNLDAEVRYDPRNDGVTYDCNIRVYRGFDGPANLRFVEFDKLTRATKRDFVLMLYKDVSDRAFWK